MSSSLQHEPYPSRLGFICHVSRDGSHTPSQGEKAGKSYLAIDKGSSVALGITIPRTVVGAASVELALASILKHLREIQGTVHATWQLGNVNIKGKLLTRQVKHLVVLLILGQKIDTRSDKVTGLCELPQVQTGALCGDTKLGVVAHSVHDTVGLTRLDIWTGSGVGSVAPVTAVVLRGIDLEDWVSEAIKNDGRVLLSATTINGALPCLESRVNLGSISRVLRKGKAREERDNSWKRRCHGEGESW
jgi:hypothetical protein